MATTQTTKELVDELDTRLLAARDAAKGLHAHLLHTSEHATAEHYLAIRHVGGILAALDEIAGRM